jgi:hypothetical protein
MLDGDRGQQRRIDEDGGRLYAVPVVAAGVYGDIATTVGLHSEAAATAGIYRNIATTFGLHSEAAATAGVHACIATAFAVYTNATSAPAPDADPGSTVAPSAVSAAAYSPDTSTGSSRTRRRYCSPSVQWIAEVLKTCPDNSRATAHNGPYCTYTAAVIVAIDSGYPPVTISHDPEVFTKAADPDSNIVRLPSAINAHAFSVDSATVTLHIQPVDHARRLGGKPRKRHARTRERRAYCCELITMCHCLASFHNPGGLLRR